MAKKRPTDVVELDGQAMEVSDEVALSEVPEIAELDRPPSNSPLWHEYVMLQLDPSEVDNNGYPKVSGLRRLTEKLVGIILDSMPTVVTDTSTRCSVNYTISVADPEANQTRTFGDVADATPENVLDAGVAKHLLATACTRAEARALRKVLKLRVLSSEEATTIKNPDGSIRDVTSGNGTETITPEQITYFEIMCKRNNIDLWKFVNADSTKYQSIEKIPYIKAQEMLRFLTMLQTGKATADDSIKGFDIKWRENVKMGGVS